MPRADPARLEATVAALAARIGAPARRLPTYGHSLDGGHPHVEVRDGAWQYVFVERGCELERRVTHDERELLYWIFEDITHGLAFEHELRHRVPGQDCRRLAFATQIELMQRVDADFADTLRARLAALLQRAPYIDRSTT